MNYQIELERILDKIKEPKKLLIHSCCAPCSSYVLEYLSNYFDITISFYNPNIHPANEYERRLSELKSFLKCFKHKNSIDLIELKYDANEFFERIKGLENEAEGGRRCFECYEMRMEHAAIIASEKGYDYFSTALTISPHKNAAKINEIGFQLEKKYGVKFLPSDFKKKNGFKRSIELSAKYNLYRQDYCGCVFSKKANLNE